MININGKKIGNERKDVYLIAEAGVNHEGDLEKAKEMIRKAAEAGADAIKFQTYKAEKLAVKDSPAYWDRTKEKTATQFDLFKKFDSFWEDEYKILAQVCVEYNIDFMSTPFDSESAEFLNPLMPAFKIASADLTNTPLLKQVAKYNKPVILSTGASTISEIYDAVQVIEEEGNTQISLLHCVLSYPTANKDAHLNMITHLKEIFPQYVIGYSDHTVPDPSLTVLNTSIFLGAKIIEKHYTLDKSLEGNDHYHAMDPKDIKVMKSNLEIYYDCLGEKFKKPLEAEKQAIKNARRSLVAAIDIPAGTVIKDEMLTWKRPGTGVSPKYIDLVTGRIAKKDIKEDTIIEWELI